MAVDNDIDTVLDERGDTLEALFWGSVFLFTLAMFFWEFGLGAIEAGEGVLQPIGTITEFAQTMWLSGLIGGGGVVILIVYAVFRYSSGVHERPLHSPRTGVVQVRRLPLGRACRREHDDFRRRRNARADR